MADLDLEAIRARLSDCDLGDGAAAAQIAEELLAEVDRLHADYNERLNALSAKLVRYRHAVAAVRSIHHPDRPEFTDNYNYEGDYDVCSACTTDPHLVRWPCNTIKAIEEAIQP